MLSMWDGMGASTLKIFNSNYLRKERKKSSMWHFLQNFFCGNGILKLFSKKRSDFRAPYFTTKAGKPIALEQTAGLGWLGWIDRPPAEKSKINSNSKKYSGKQLDTLLVACCLLLVATFEIVYSG